MIFLSIWCFYLIANSGETKENKARTTCKKDPQLWFMVSTITANPLCFQFSHRHSHLSTVTVILQLCNLDTGLTLIQNLLEPAEECSTLASSSAVCWCCLFESCSTFTLTPHPPNHWSWSNNRQPVWTTVSYCTPSTASAKLSTNLNVLNTLRDCWNLSMCMCVCVFVYMFLLYKKSIPRLMLLSLSFTFLAVLVAGLTAAPCLPPADPHLWMLGVAARPGLLDRCFERALCRFCMILSGHQADELLSSDISVGLAVWHGGSHHP